MRPFGPGQRCALAARPPGGAPPASREPVTTTSSSSSSSSNNNNNDSQPGQPPTRTSSNGARRHTSGEPTTNARTRLEINEYCSSCLAARWQQANELFCRHKFKRKFKFLQITSALAGVLIQLAIVHSISTQLNDSNTRASTSNERQDLLLVFSGARGHELGAHQLIEVGKLGSANTRNSAKKPFRPAVRPGRAPGADEQTWVGPIKHLVEYDGGEMAATNHRYELRPQPGGRPARRQAGASLQGAPGWRHSRPQAPRQQRRQFGQQRARRHRSAPMGPPTSASGDDGPNLVAVGERRAPGGKGVHPTADEDANNNDAGADYPGHGRRDWAPDNGRPISRDSAQANWPTGAPGHGRAQPQESAGFINQLDKGAGLASTAAPTMSKGDKDSLIGMEEQRQPTGQSQSQSQAQNNGEPDENNENEPADDEEEENANDGLPIGPSSVALEADGPALNGNDQEPAPDELAGDLGAGQAFAFNSSQCDSFEDILAARPSRPVGLVFGLNYSIIFVFGLLGNVLTLYVLLCKGKKCTVQDILIANLACSDIMLCVFAVPITPKYLILDGHWTLGSALCKIVSFAQSTSVYMSTYSLICIGYIRYRLIIHPLEESMSKQTALLSCLGTWLVGIIVTLPYMLQVRLSPENCRVKFCDEAWEKPYRFIFSLFTAFFQFMIPLGSVGFFNKKIYSRLDGRIEHKTGAAVGPQGPHSIRRPDSATSNNHQHHNSVGLTNLAREPDGAPTGGQQQLLQQHQIDVMAMKEQRQREKEKRMRKANNRLIFVVVIFAHSWLPLNLFNIAQDYFEGLAHWPYLTNTFLIVHQIACSSVCWNPILYAWMSETYRQDLRNALPQFIVARSRCLLDPSHHHQSGSAATTKPSHQSYHQPNRSTASTNSIGAPVHQGQDNNNNNDDDEDDDDDDDDDKDKQNHNHHHHYQYHHHHRQHHNHLANSQEQDEPLRQQEHELSDIAPAQPSHAGRRIV